MLPFFDANHIAAALDPLALIDAMDRALAAFSAGTVIQPLRTRVHDPESNGTVYLMPAFTDVFAVKIVGNYPGNHARGIDSHNAVVIVFDRATGVPRAVLDGTAVTTARTAAVSAAVARRLALPDARVLAILGSGVQARSHLDFMRRVRPFDEVRVWSRDPDRAHAFAASVGARATSAEEAVRGADVVCTTTAATEPILQGSWLKPGAHVSAVGWSGPAGRELDAAAMRHVVVVESREAVLAESGNVILAEASIFAEYGELVAGRARVDPRDTTVFVSVGMAVEDAFAAGLLLPRLLAAGTAAS